MPAHAFPKILAIIPCYNEGAGLGKLLHEFRNLSFPCDTLVIDDCSADGTYAVASQYSSVIRFDCHRGLQAGIKAGLRFAAEHDYDYCVQIDGDGQHIPREIERLMKEAQHSSCNLTIGSRYYKNFLPFTGGLRHVAGIIFSVFVFALFRGRWVYDPLSGMRMMYRTAIRYFDGHLNVRIPDSAILPQALKASLTVGEARVEMRPRLFGRSYFSGLKGVTFLLRLLWVTLCIRFKPEMPRRPV